RLSSKCFSLLIQKWICCKTIASFNPISLANDGRINKGLSLISNLLIKITSIINLIIRSTIEGDNFDEKWDILFLNILPPLSLLLVYGQVKSKSGTYYLKYFSNNFDVMYYILFLNILPLLSLLLVYRQVKSKSGTFYLKYFSNTIHFYILIRMHEWGENQRNSFILFPPHYIRA